jgi:hypothetical protein
MHAAASTPPRTGDYAPLVAAMPCNDDNPFSIDLGADDNDSANGGSPLLLTDPAGVDGDPANAMAILPVLAGVSKDSGMRSGVDLAEARDLIDARDHPPLATPGTVAAILVDFALLLKKHVSALNERIDTLHAEAASNHGHITKCLFPAFDAQFTALKTTVATSTATLKAKGASLLAKCTALEDRVSSIVKGLPPALESAEAAPQAQSGPREPPDDSPQRFHQGQSNTPTNSVPVGSEYNHCGKRMLRLIASLALRVTTSLGRMPPPLPHLLRLSTLMRARMSPTRPHEL